MGKDTNRKHHTGLALVIVCCFALAACDPPPGPGPGIDGDAGAVAPSMVDCAIDEPMFLAVGGGSSLTGFVDLADGADMTGVLGPQGLYMVTPSIRGRGMYPGTAGRVGNADDPQIVIEVLAGGAVVGGSARENLGLTSTPDGYEKLGIFTPFEGNVSEYAGREVTLRATVSDACGNTITDELTIVVRQ